MRQEACKQACLHAAEHCVEELSNDEAGQEVEEHINALHRHLVVLHLEQFDSPSRTR